MLANLWASLEESIRSPWVAALNVVFGVVAGILATTFHEELSRAVPLIWFRSGWTLDFHSWSWPAFSFWGFVFSFSCLWAKREAVAAADRKSEFNSLENLIETVAPPDFLHQFEKLYMECANLDKTTGKTQDQLFSSLRLVLDAVIQLAAQWDYSTAALDDVYRANVMTLVDKGELEEKKHISAGSRLLGESGWNSALANCDGGLWTESKLATSIIDTKGEEDSDVRDLLLLYSEKNGINFRGAPQAFISKKMDYVEDTKIITRQFPRELSQFAREIAEKGYASDDKAKSLISLPLPGQNEFTGVLNIYRNTPGIMGSEPRATNFARILAPFTKILGQILEKTAQTP